MNGEMEIGVSEKEVCCFCGRYRIPRHEWLAAALNRESHSFHKCGRCHFRPRRPRSKKCLGRAASSRTRLALIKSADVLIIEAEKVTVYAQNSA